MYILILYVTVLYNNNGVAAIKQETQRIKEFQTLRECYNYAKEIKLNVELYSCITKNP